MVSLNFRFEKPNVVQQSFEEYPIISEIALYLAGEDLVQLSRASKWLYFTMWGWPSIWKKALQRAGVDIDVTALPFHSIYTRSILSFTIDCMLCGTPTKNGVLGKGDAATRLCSKCAANVLVPAPEEEQPVEFMQTIYHGGPHRFFKMVLRHGAIGVRIPTLLLHSKPAILYKAFPSLPHDRKYIAGKFDGVL
ncbi:hypothetical protein RhiTH_011288 [Rhizoctonia solani]